MAEYPMLSRLYSTGSLRPVVDGPGAATGFRFEVKNRLFAAIVEEVRALAVDGVDVPLADVTMVRLGDGRDRAVSADRAAGVDLPLGAVLEVRVTGRTLSPGTHELHVSVRAEPFGPLDFTVTDQLAVTLDRGATIPRLDDDWSDAAVEARRTFLAEHTGVTPTHLYRTSIRPEQTHGNIEHLVGAAQVPVGIAGPLRIDGEHCRGDVLVPMATTEGTLVASYNRGMKALTLAGGVTTTVLDDRMQRAPVFVFDSAREARDFVAFVESHLDDLAAAAASTTRHGELVGIEPYLASHLAFLRFDFRTGDAAGQNMVGKATFAACSWLLQRVPGVRRFFLEGNLATDKKASHVNLLHTRGKRVVAECVLPRAVLAQVLRVHPESLLAHSSVANVGSFLAGVNNNGLHAANGVAAMFIACGQDAANVAEASAGVIQAEATADGDLYLSMTLPALIVATHGGGTGLPTQRECLELLGCTGPGSALRLAEIVAAVVLAGELSLAAAISSMDWVSSHEQYGRNR
jgi:hydroxymethylglutaryl-CoA reductase (NADPH)